MSTNIGDIIDTVPCVYPDEKNKTIDKLFMDNNELQGIVVVDQEKPVALIPRTHFYQKIGTYKSVEELVEHVALLKKRCKAVQGSCCIEE